MPLYLTPEVPASATEFRELVSRSGTKFVESGKLYDVITAASGSAVVIAAVPEFQVHLLCSNMDLLLPEQPTKILGIPEVNYPMQWNVYTQSLVVIDWMELSGKLATSGLLATNTEQVAERMPNRRDRTPEKHRNAGKHSTIQNTGASGAVEDPEEEGMI